MVSSLSFKLNQLCTEILSMTGLDPTRLGINSNIFRDSSESYRSLDLGFLITDSQINHTLGENRFRVFDSQLRYGNHTLGVL